VEWAEGGGRRGGLTFQVGTMGTREFSKIKNRFWVGGGKNWPGGFCENGKKHVKSDRSLPFISDEKAGRGVGGGGGGTYVWLDKQPS